MYRGIVLPQGKTYQSPCPKCKVPLTIYGDPNIGGYKYPRHYASLKETDKPGSKCIASEDPVTEEELRRLFFDRS